MESTFVTGDKILIVIEVLVLDFLVFLGFKLIVRDSIWRCITKSYNTTIFMIFVFIFIFYNSIVTIGEGEGGLAP